MTDPYRWDGADYDGLAAFLGEELYSHVSYSSPAPGTAPASAHICTIEGIVTAAPGDWIIKSGHGLHLEAV